MGAYVAFLIVLFNMTSFRASKVLVTLFGIELGAAQFFIGILVATYSIFPMLLAIYAGKLSDRLGVRMPMLLGSFGMSAALAFPFFYPQMPALYVSAALLGVSHIFYNVSMQNLIGSLGGPEDRTRNFNNYSLVMAVGSFIGPLAAGVSIDLAGYARTYLYLALVPLISIALIVSARGTGRPRGVEAHAGKHTADGKGLLASARLRRTLITSAVVLTGIDLFQFYMPIYGHYVGLSASAIGVVLSMFAAAAFVIRIALPAMARRWGEERLLTWSLILGAATYVLFPFFDSAPALAVVAFGLGLSLGLGQPLSLMLIYASSPPGRTGEALGLRMTINNFTHIVVPVVFGALGTALGVAPVFVANALMLAGGGVLTRRSVKT
jgi:MFS family permease